TLCMLKSPISACLSLSRNLINKFTNNYIFSEPIHENRVGALTFGFNSLNRNTHTMRYSMKSTLVLFFAFALTFVTQAQKRGFNDSTLLVHESVDNKFSQMKAKSGNIEVIFRKDRLEIFEKTPNGIEEKQSFLFFNDSNKVEPKAIGLLTSGTKQIPNENMAAVLGADEMNVSTYKKIVYENLYNGANLEISVVNRAIQFSIVSKSNVSDIPFSLSSWNDSDMIKLDDIIKLVNHESFEIYSNNTFLAVDGKDLNFAQTNKSASQNITFTLNFLN
ncbi:MAG: hypothetical protein KJN84_04250, partial [Bacteroidia bacterium]|nr:hypothetical protein [Bacteroidia bacterium]